MVWWVLHTSRVSKHYIVWSNHTAVFRHMTHYITVSMHTLQWLVLRVKSGYTIQLIKEMLTGTRWKTKSRGGITRNQTQDTWRNQTQDTWRDHQELNTGHVEESNTGHVEQSPGIKHRTRGSSCQCSATELNCQTTTSPCNPLYVFKCILVYWIRLLHTIHQILPLFTFTAAVGLTNM